MKEYSIQSILLRTLTILSVFIVLVVSVLLYSHFYRETHSMLVHDSELVVEKASHSIENYIDATSQLFHIINHTIDKSEDLHNSQLMQNIENLLFARQDVVSIAYVNRNGELLYSYPNVEVKETAKLAEQEWFYQAITQDTMHISHPHVLNMYYGQFPWVVSFSKPMTMNKNGQLYEGVLVLHVNFHQIESLLEQITDGARGYVYVLEDSGGRVVYHPRQELFNANLQRENIELALKMSYGSKSYKNEQGQTQLMSVLTVSNVGWKIVGVINIEQTLLSNIALKGPIITLSVAFLLLIFIICSLISRWISYPIKKLERTMKQISNRELTMKFDELVDPHAPQEVHQLSVRFEHMMETIKQLMDKIVVEQELKRTHELNALQLQINPHFLYNTLDMVVSMVGVNKNDEVIKTVTALSRLFRLSIGKGKAEITISEELEHVRNYLMIQQIRFKHKFDYIIEIDEEVKTLLTLKLIIQPIVENAIKHGLEQSVDKGLIKVAVKLVAGKVEFVIEDNGLGMSEQRLEQLRSGKYESVKGTGVGLRNVLNRIQLYYGMQYTVTIQSELEEGTKVVITIPIKEQYEVSN